TFSLSHFYADSGNYAVTLVVTSDAGASGTGWARVIVNNVAPTVNAGADQTANEGSPVTLNGTASDPGVTDQLTYPRTAASWNGQSVSDGIAPTLPFTPVDNGTYTVTLSVTDKDGATGSDTAVVTVNNVAPTANAGGNRTVNEGSAVTLNGSATDPGALDTFA